MARLNTFKCVASAPDHCSVPMVPKIRCNCARLIAMRTLQEAPVLETASVIMACRGQWPACSRWIHDACPVLQTKSATHSQITKPRPCGARTMHFCKSTMQPVPHARQLCTSALATLGFSPHMNRRPSSPTKWPTTFSAPTIGSRPY